MRLFLTCKLICIGIFCLCINFTPAYAQLIAVEEQSLSFGSFSFVSMNEPIVIAIDPSGNVTSNSNVVLLNTPQRGEYTLTGGTPNAMFSITSPPSVTLSSGPQGSFTIDDIAVSPASASFDGFGEARITVGGRIQSNGGGTQYSNGNYAGTLTITVSY